MIPQNPELREAQTAFTASSMAVDYDKLEETANYLRTMGPVETADVDIDVIKPLDHRLGFMLNAAIGEEYLNPDYAARKNATDAGGDNLNGDVLYKGLLAAYASDEDLFNVIALSNLTKDPTVFTNSWRKMVSQEGLEQISDFTGNLVDYVTKKFIKDKDAPNLPLRAYSTLVSGQLIYSGAEITTNINIFGEDSLNSRLAGVGLEEQQWVARSFARWIPELNFSDLDQMTIFPSPPIFKSLEVYGVVKPEDWPKDEEEKGACAVWLGHLLAEKSGRTPLDLDLHFYQFGEANK